MGAVVLGVVGFTRVTGGPCIFREACQKARVSFACESVPSGQLAMDYLSGRGAYADRARHPIPSLVLIDLDFEPANGLRLLKWIRAQPGFRYLPVVVVSASKSQADMRRAYDRGATSYLIRPSNFKALVELVKLIDKYWLMLNQTPGP